MDDSCSDGLGLLVAVEGLTPEPGFENEGKIYNTRIYKKKKMPQRSLGGLLDPRQECIEREASGASRTTHWSKVSEKDLK